MTPTSYLCSNTTHLGKERNLLWRALVRAMLDEIYQSSCAAEEFPVVVI